jgi:N-acetylated-alpha-linked acidic dipeptidase
MRLTAVFGVVVAALTLLSLLPGPDRDPPFGFTRSSTSAHLDVERRFLAEPDAKRIRDRHRLLTSRPHPAGSPRDRELAEWTAQQFRDTGMEEVRITAHDVLLPEPLEVGVEMTRPRPWRASMHEPAIAGDADTNVDPALAGPAFHAYSASGEVSAPVVYAGSGDPSDYAWLAARGVDVRGRIVIVRHSVPYSYRGFKALTAQQHGAAGLLIFSDPGADGSAVGKPYPDGPWSPDTRIERGGIVFDFLVPGDPLTPGWASVPGARRIERADAASLPRILSLPLSATDARPILEALGGPVVPLEWRGGFPIEYRAGPGPAHVRMTVRIQDEIRPIWTVTGLFRGSISPDEVVILGNHRDAWVFGGVDPSSGSAVLLELAEILGTLRRGGWRPGRSVMFASWDAEELALTSSTEWGEQHASWLRDRAVAYLNVDSAASGSRFVSTAAPSLTRLVAEVTGLVRDPIEGIPVAARAREQRNAARGASGDTLDDRFIDNRPGGGSDYTVFLNHLGIPVADLGFDGPYGVYHSAYDTHQWVARFGDPGFRYHAALVRILGLAALRLSCADVLPLDPGATAAAVGGFLDDTERRHPLSDLSALRLAVTELSEATAAFGRARDAALDREDGAALLGLNNRLRIFERAFLDPEGLPGRPWYRHLVHAPQFTYHPEVLPGISEALQAGDPQRLANQVAALSAALRRAAAVIEPNGEDRVPTPSRKAF